MIYLLYIPLALIGLIMASGAIYRAWSRGVPRVYWLAAFWLLFSVHFAFHPPVVIYVSMVFLAIYWFATWRYGSNLARKYERLRPIIGEAGEAPMTWFKAAALGEMSSRRKVEAKAQVSSKQEQEKAQLAVAKNKRIALDFTLPAAQRFPVEGGGLLELAAGPIHLDVLLQAEPMDEVHCVKVTTSIGDEQGMEWRAVSYMSLSTWLEALDEKDRDFTGWDKAGIGWNKAIWWGTQVAAADELLDSREYKTVKINGAVYEYKTKYQGPKIDIAWVENDLSWLVRVSELRMDFSKLPPAATDDDAKIPLFAWTHPGTFAALPLHPEWHASSPDEILKELVERPIVFSMTGKKLAVQAGVKFLV